MTCELSLDELISSVVKTPEEIEEENKHSWLKLQPPTCCFENCFKRDAALNPHNWKNIFPEYYWLYRKKRNAKQQIKQHKYKSDEELQALQRSVEKYNELIESVMNPNKLKHKITSK